MHLITYSPKTLLSYEIKTMAIQKMMMMKTIDISAICKQCREKLKTEMECELSRPPTCLPGAISRKKKDDSMQLTCASHMLSSTTRPADSEVCIAEPAFKQ